MAKQPGAEGYQPYKGKRRPHLQGRCRVQSRVEASFPPPPPRPQYNDMVLGKPAPNVDRSRDDALPPRQGLTHTARLLAALSE